MRSKSETTKDIVITGPKNSGKSWIAEAILLTHRADEVVAISWNPSKLPIPFFKNYDIRVVIVDGLNSIEDKLSCAKLRGYYPRAVFVFTITNCTDWMDFDPNTTHHIIAISPQTALKSIYDGAMRDTQNTKAQ